MPSCQFTYAIALLKILSMQDSIYAAFHRFILIIKDSNVVRYYLEDLVKTGTYIVHIMVEKYQKACLLFWKVIDQ